MKKRLILTLMLLTALFIFVACSDALAPMGGMDDRGFSSSGSSENGGASQVLPGQLTAGEWNDLQNMEFWRSLISEKDVFNSSENDISEQQPNEIATFVQKYGALEQGTLSVKRIIVRNGDLPVFNAKVELFSDEKVVDCAYTDAQGRAYVFAIKYEGLKIRATLGEAYSELEIEADSDDFDEIVVELNTASIKPNVLQLMFVVDTTGSMGDEIDYLKAEIKDVASRVEALSEGSTLQIALLFYRDNGDEYVTRYFDFTSDVDFVLKNISNQTANGGGDYEEAVGVAFSEAVDKQWSSGASKLIIHVADAPYHYDNQEDDSRYFAAIERARNLGIRIVSVASSGVDKATEFLMRQHGILTGGTYIFLTNDSGIGNEKIIPTVGEYVTEYLNDCLVRVAARYLIGKEIEPVPYNQAQDN